MRQDYYPYFVITAGILFYIFSGLLSLGAIVGSDGGGTVPFEAYHNNPTIKSFYKVSLSLNIIGIVCLLYAAWKKNEYGATVKIFFALLVVGQIILIWYEMYYGSTFYYGEVRDKHGFFCSTSINNQGIVGSIFLVMLLYNFLFNKLQPIPFWISNMVIFWTIILLHYIVYEMVEVSWKLWTS